jgi:hypothetical protein
MIGGRSGIVSAFMRFPSASHRVLVGVVVKVVERRRKGLVEIEAYARHLAVWAVALSIILYGGGRPND